MYSLDIQTTIPAALAGIHNFTHHHEPDEGDRDGDELICGRVKNDGDGDAEWADVGVNKPDIRQDSMATVIWEQYVNKHIT